MLFRDGGSPGRRALPLRGAGNRRPRSGRGGRGHRCREWQERGALVERPRQPDPGCADAAGAGDGVRLRTVPGGGAGGAPTVAGCSTTHYLTASGTTVTARRPEPGPCPPGDLPGGHGAQPQAVPCRAQVLGGRVLPVRAVGLEADVTTPGVPPQPEPGAAVSADAAAVREAVARVLSLWPWPSAVSLTRGSTSGWPGRCRSTAPAGSRWRCRPRWRRGTVRSGRCGSSRRSRRSTSGCSGRCRAR